MSALSQIMNEYRGLLARMTTVPDPGASGTLGFHNKASAIFEIVTAGAESRALPSASAYAVGSRLLVILKTAGGNLTVTGGEDGSSVLTTAGDIVEFVVVDKNGTKVWKNTIFDADLDSVESDIAALQVDVQGTFTHEIPVPAWRIWDSLDTQLGATPASADDLAHVIGTFLTDAGYLTTTSQTPGDANPVVSRARYIVRVPDNYQDGDALTFRMTWTRPDAAVTSMTLDAEVVRVAAPSVDICATAAQDINAAASGTANFTLTPTNVVAGELLNIRITITAVSNGASYEGRVLTTKLIHTV